MKIDARIETYPTRAAWLAARRDPTSISASEAAAALGVHPHLNAWGLWERKRAAASGGREDEALQRGHRWESAVLAEYEDAAGVRVVRPGAAVGRPEHLVILASAAHPWLRESPDAFAIDPHGLALGHVEAKTAMHRDAWSPERGVVIERWAEGAEALVPPHYAVQGYVQLAVSGLPWNDLCALVLDGSWLAVRWVRLLRDEETQGQLVEALAAWRERHLVGGEAPDVDGSRACNRFLARAFQARPARVATADEAAKLRELARPRAEVKAAEARVDALSNELTAAAEGARLLLSDAKGAPYGQPQRLAGRTTVDAERLRTEFPEAYAACQRTGEASIAFRTYRFEKDNDKDNDHVG